MSGPLSPEEILSKKRELIPDFVFEAFNDCIAKDYNGKSVVIKQDDVVDAILYRMAPSQRHRETVFDNHWLDVESAYKKVGWDVEYDKPGYNESYPTTFTFRKKKST